MPIDIQTAFEQGRQPDFFQKYGGALKELQGNVSDITRYDNFSEAMNDLAGFQQYHDNLNRVNDIKTKLNSVDLSKIPNDKEVQKPVINTDYFEMLPEEEWPKEIKDWHGYTESLKGKDGKYSKTPATFDEYLQTLGKRDNFVQAHPNAYKSVTAKEQLTPEEIEAEYYHQAGLKPEDVAFYKEYGDKITAKDLDDKLQTLLTNYAPLLQSEGSMGDTFLKQFAAQVKNRVVEPTAPTKYDTKIDPKTGEVIYIDPTRPGNVKTYKYADVNKKPDDDSKQDWDYNYDEQGNPYWGQWKKNPQTNEFEFVKTAEFTAADKEKLSNDKEAFNKKMTSGRTGRSRVGRRISEKEKISKMNPEDLKNLKPEDIEGKDLEYLRVLEDNKKMLSSDTKAALEDMLTGNTKKDQEKYSSSSNVLEEGLKGFADDFKSALDPQGFVPAEQEGYVQDLVKEMYDWLGDLEKNESVDSKALKEAYSTVDQVVKQIKWTAK